MWLVPAEEVRSGRVFHFGSTRRMPLLVESPMVWGK